MPVPFRDLTGEDEDLGLADYLRFIDEPDARGVRGCLFCVNAASMPGANRSTSAFRRSMFRRRFFGGPAIRSGAQSRPLPSRFSTRASRRRRSCSRGLTKHPLGCSRKTWQFACRSAGSPAWMRVLMRRWTPRTRCPTPRISSGLATHRRRIQRRAVFWGR